MANINTVIVLCNGDVYGVWVLPADFSLRIAQKNDLRHIIKEKVKAMDTEDVFTVHFDESFQSDSLEELTEGILESIENSY